MAASKKVTGNVKTLQKQKPKKPVRRKSVSVKKNKNKEDKENIIRCPNCGSTQLTVGKHSIEGGFDATGALIANYLTKSSLAGFLVGGLNSGNTTSSLFVYCLNCRSEFKPDELSPESAKEKEEYLLASLPQGDNIFSRGCSVIVTALVILLVIMVVLAVIGSM